MARRCEGFRALSERFSLARYVEVFHRFSSVNYWPSKILHSRRGKSNRHGTRRSGVKATTFTDYGRSQDTNPRRCCNGIMDIFAINSRVNRLLRGTVTIKVVNEEWDPQALTLNADFMISPELLLLFSLHNRILCLHAKAKAGPLLLHPPQIDFIGEYVSL